MNSTFYKVMFVVWLVFVFWGASLAVFSFIDGSFDMNDFVIALCGIVICQLYWELWHRPVVENKQYVLIKYKEPQPDLDITIDDFTAKYDKRYYRGIADSMEFDPAYSFDKLVKIVEESK